MKRLAALAMIVAFVPLAAMAQKPSTRSNGTTLAATKTLEICDAGGGQWTYSGIVAVWNSGVINTEGLQIQDCIQNKVGNKFQDAICPPIAPTEIAAGTSLETATVFPYSITGAALAGDIRNRAWVSILNHSGSLGKRTGPEPKATWTGGEPVSCGNCEGPNCGNARCFPAGEGQPPNCFRGCSYSFGYWKTPGSVDDPHTWPTAIDPNATFYLSGLTWMQVIQPGAGNTGYYQLARQFVAAMLNAATESVPAGVSDLLEDAHNWFTTNAPSACAAGGSCGTQKGWAETLARYNLGTYPAASAPPHCADEVVE